MRKITIVTLVLLASLTLAVSGCAKKPVNQPTNQNVNANLNATTTAEIDTSNWKTYRNEEYGFEFKYPQQIGNVEFVLHESSVKNFYGVGDLLTVVIRPLPWQDYMFAIGLMNKKFTQNEFEKLYYSEDRKLKTFDLASHEVNGFYSQTLGLSEYSIFLDGNLYNYLIRGGGCEEINLASKTCSDLGYSTKILDAIISSIRIN